MLIVQQTSLLTQHRRNCILIGQSDFGIHLLDTSRMLIGRYDFDNAQLDTHHMLIGLFYSGNTLQDMLRTLIGLSDFGIHLLDTTRNPIDLYYFDIVLLDMPHKLLGQFYSGRYLACMVCSLTVLSHRCRCLARTVNTCRTQVAEHTNLPYKAYIPHLYDITPLDMLELSILYNE